MVPLRDFDCTGLVLGSIRVRAEGGAAGMVLGRGLLVRRNRHFSFRERFAIRDVCI